MRRCGSIHTGTGLGVSDHVCWTYADDEELLDGALAFLSDGRRLGQRLVYVADKPRAELLDDLRELPDLRGLLDSRALSVIALGEHYDASYRIGAQHQLAAYRAATDQAVADGYAGLRAVAEVTPMVRGVEERQAFARWEQLGERYMAQGRPLAVMCGYDRRVLDRPALDEVECVHPLVHDHSGQVPFRLFGDGDDLVLEGEIDAFSAPGLEQVLANAEHPAGTVLDLTRLAFIDHHGIHELARHAAVLARSGRTLTLRGAAPVVRRLWRLVVPEDANDVRWV